MDEKEHLGDTGVDGNITRFIKMDVIKQQDRKTRTGLTRIIRGPGGDPVNTGKHNQVP